MKSNIVLIGMPGCGKSTAGVLLAKVLGKDFMDTDVVMQAREGRFLQQILDGEGIDAFLDRECRAVLSIQAKNTVIATGGSVVYRARAMEHLKKDGLIVYIRLPYEEIVARIHNLSSRGVALRPGETLEDEYTRRCPLYEQYAELILDGGKTTLEQSVDRLRLLIKDVGY